MAATHWKTIAIKLGLEDTTPGFNNNTARQQNYDDRQCVIEVFDKWFKNANRLPNAHRYPKTWDGLHTLLDDIELGEVAAKLSEALEAADSNIRKS